MINKFGLNRDIPENIKREIRQKSGFGCVFCGDWIYQYEHILPEFKDAKIHDPEKICLLCTKHHQKVTVGRISKQQVTEAYRHPKALQRGYANDYLEMGRKFGIVLGRIFIPEPKTILTIDDIPLITFIEPTNDEPAKLTAKLFDDKGNLSLEIKENEIFGYVKNWDIDQQGTRTIIRKGRGKIVLQMNILSEHILEIEKINMVYGNGTLKSNSETGKIFIQSASGATIDFDYGEIMTEGISINENEISFDKGMFLGSQFGLAKMDYEGFMRGEPPHSITSTNESKKSNPPLVAPAGESLIK